tara:strand:- start:548 stop:826 length:279 start_codon:yes stop_codon:yes gene_type:complete
MQWNYRIVSEEAPEGEFLQVYEIYYDDGKIIGMLENPSKPYGDNIDELQADMNYMMDAFRRPVLKLKDLENAFKRGQSLAWRIEELQNEARS